MFSKNTSNYFVIFLTALSIAGLFWLYVEKKSNRPSFSEQEIVFDEPDIEKESDESLLHPRLRGLGNWERPKGPWRVALQVGHWKASEAPEELENLRVNTGASHQGTAEWEVALAIAEDTKKKLEDSNANIIVEILPTTIPQNYWADVFVSIHADGNVNSSVSGYKVAAPWRDYTGKASGLVKLLESEYESATNLRSDPNITRTMRGYYAFNWRRYDHSIHPMTVAAIVETGFLTNAGDRRVIVNAPEKSADGISNGILKFLDATEKTAQVFPGRDL